MKEFLVAWLMLVLMAMAGGCIVRPPQRVYVTTSAPRAVYVRPAPAPPRVVVRVTAPPPPRARVHVHLGR